jgi:hypothetical protein
VTVGGGAELQVHEPQASPRSLSVLGHTSTISPALHRWQPGWNAANSRRPVREGFLEHSSAP